MTAIATAVDTQVRMILYDYDAAPDGVGTYTKLNAVFPSKGAALQHRSRFMHDMYWGKIETLDGQLVQTLKEKSNDDRDYGDWD